MLREETHMPGILMTCLSLHFNSQTISNQVLDMGTKTGEGHKLCSHSAPQAIIT